MATYSEYDESQSVNILYRNWKGRVAVRRIIPIEMRFESNQWHPEEQWILHAYDIDEKDERGFACLSILAWYKQ